MVTLEALKYLASADLYPRNEWTEAGMYNSMCKVANSNQEEWSKEELDELINDAENN